MTCKRIFALALSAAAGGTIGVLGVSLVARFIMLLLRGPQF